LLLFSIVIKAQDLPGSKSGPINPLMLLAVRKETSKDHEKKIDIKKTFQQTKVIQKSLNPIWNESFEM
jgi:Ca2+-dependent lipid-binding protein